MSSYNSGEVVITSGALLQTVERHFKRINEEQWAMLLNGSSDIESKTVLLQMFIQLVQTLSTDVLKLLKPMTEEVVDRCSPEGDTKIAFHDITTVLDEPIADVFAKALNIKALPMGQHSFDLTVMLQSEISEKVNSVLLTASDGSQWTVNSSLSTVDAGFRMVDKARHCLKAFLPRFIPRSRSKRSKSLNTIQKAKPVEPTVPGASESAVEKHKIQCQSFLAFAKRQFDELTSSVLSLAQSETEPAPTTSSHIKSPKIDFNSIQEDVEELFEELDTWLIPDSNQCFQDFLRSEEIVWFYKKLSNRLYDHLQMTESVLTVKQKPDSVQSLSPQLLYAMVEDEVAMFIQKLLFFMQEPPEEDLHLQKTNYNVFEIWLLMRKPKSPVSTKLNQLNCERFAKAHCMIEALLMTIYNGKPTYEEFTAIVKRLTQKIWDKIDIPNTHILLNNMSKIIKAVMKNLQKEFGTAARLLASALDPTDTSFEAAVLKYLKHQLDVMKKSPLARFFSHIWKKIPSPLRTQFPCEASCCALLYPSPLVD